MTEVCPTCKGRTFMFIKGANGQERCKTCQGTGLGSGIVDSEAKIEDLDLAAA